LYYGRSNMRWLYLGVREISFGDLGVLAVSGDALRLRCFGGAGVEVGAPVYIDEHLRKVKQWCMRSRLRS
jgi:hypothetical protein